MMDDKLVNMWLPVSDLFTTVAMATAVVCLSAPAAV